VLRCARFSTRADSLYEDYERFSFILMIRQDLSLSVTDTLPVLA